jgi:hypothetical protein
VKHFDGRRQALNSRQRGGGVTQKSFEKRVDMPEKRVEILERLPERVGAVELQIVQLRHEVSDEFSAVRAEIRAGDEETRRVLREEIRTGDEETRRYMRILREEVIARIAAIGEAR